MTRRRVASWLSLLGTLALVAGCSGGTQIAVTVVPNGIGRTIPATPQPGLAPAGGEGIAEAASDAPAQPAATPPLTTLVAVVLTPLVQPVTPEPMAAATSVVSATSAASPTTTGTATATTTPGTATPTETTSATPTSIYPTVTPEAPVATTTLLPATATLVAQPGVPLQPPPTFTPAPPTPVPPTPTAVPPTPTPSPTFTPTPTPTPTPAVRVIAGSMLGATKADWVEARGSARRNGASDSFSGGFDVTWIGDGRGQDRAARIDLQLGRAAISVDEARQLVRPLLPPDLQLVRAYTARPGGTVEVFRSALLAEALAGSPRGSANFGGEAPGTFFQIADQGGGTTSTVLIGIGAGP